MGCAVTAFIWEQTAGTDLLVQPQGRDAVRPLSEESQGPKLRWLQRRGKERKRHNIDFEDLTTFLETKGLKRVRADTEAPSLTSRENSVTMDKTTKSGRKAHFRAKGEL